MQVIFLTMRLQREMKSSSRTMRLQREMKSSSWTMRLKRANEVAHFDDEAQAVESDFSIERRQGAHSCGGGGGGDKYF